MQNHHLSFTGARHTDFVVVLPPLFFFNQFIVLHLFITIMHLFVILCLFVINLYVVILVILCLVVVVLPIFVVILCLCSSFASRFGHFESHPGCYVLI